MLALALVLFAALFLEHDVTAERIKAALDVTQGTTRHFGEVLGLGIRMIRIHPAKVRRNVRGPFYLRLF